MTDDHDLTCKELVEIVTDYLEGRLPPRDRLRFEEHLLVCPGCATYIEQMRDTIALVGALGEEDIPRPAEEALLRAFREWKRG
jgi:anti-sigma factor RsiW